MQTYDRQKQKKETKQDSRNQDNFGYSGAVLKLVTRAL